MRNGIGRLTNHLAPSAPLVFLLYLLLGGFLLVPVRLSAQRKCGTMPHLEHQLQTHPHMRRSLHDIDASTLRQPKSPGQTINIPVVVHVLYHTAEENISDAQIRTQIEVLNADFRRRNHDKHETDPRWQGVAADTRIQFALASRTPSGEATTGITRTYTRKAAFYASDNAAKYSSQGGADAWAPQHYLNIWVCHLGMGVLGYAQFPGGPRETDGVVISYAHFGTIGTVAHPFDRGRTTTHEVGHWLNLRHIWGDGGCEADDHVSDTPPAARPNHGCASYRETCGGPDMVQNFMDYTDDACMNLFTQRQAQRMRALFAAGGFREEILRSPALQTPVPPILALDAPNDVQLLEAGTGFARLRWTPVAGADAYRVRLRQVGSTRWIERAFDRAFVNPSQLKTCTEYECQVATLWEEEQSDFSRSLRFQTLGCGHQHLATQRIPKGLSVMEEGAGVVRLRWEPVPQAVAYDVQLKRLGSKRIVERQPTVATARVGGLQAGHVYLYRVRGNFQDAQPADYSVIHQFSYGAMAHHGYRSLVETTSRYTRYQRAHRRILIRLPLEEPATFTARLRRADGGLVKTYDSGTLSPEKTVSLPLPDLRSGTYLLELVDEDGFVYTERFHH